MKNLLFLLIPLFLLSCKDRNDDPEQPVTELSKLPPATQTGANKVGCLLDGKAFLPGNYNNSTNCFYQFVDGEYYFVMGLDNKDADYNLTAIAIGTQKKQIHQGEVYNLYELSENNAYGGYIYNTFESNTTHTHTGKLTITKLDTVNQIVAGTFWYDILDHEGKLHQIRDGRFDFKYTN